MQSIWDTSESRFDFPAFDPALLPVQKKGASGCRWERSLESGTCGTPVILKGLRLDDVLVDELTLGVHFFRIHMAYMFF